MKDEEIVGYLISLAGAFIFFLAGMIFGKIEDAMSLWFVVNFLGWLAYITIKGL